VARIDADGNPVIAFERMNRSSARVRFPFPFRSVRRPQSLLLAALAIAIPVVADTVVIRGDRVNVRSQPNLDGEVLAWMKRGETVETQGSAKDGFIRIALPSRVAVWVYAPLVDRAAHQVKAPEARLRVGPGRNYGELGVLKKGAALTEIRESDGWLQVEPPAGLSAYIGAQFIDASGAPAAKVAAQKTGGVLPADGAPIVSTATTPVAAKPALMVPVPVAASPSVSSASLISPAASVSPVSPTPIQPQESSLVVPVSGQAGSFDPSGGGVQSSIQYTENVRIVTRVGKVVRSLEPQSPSHYQLRSPQRGEGMLGFLIDQDPKTQTPIASFRGKTVRVVAEEYVDPRSRTQVILRVQGIEEASTR
jgi:uncharacterized protein YgiM (DUF1202 family)